MNNDNEEAQNALNKLAQFYSTVYNAAATDVSADRAGTGGGGTDMDLAGAKSARALRFKRSLKYGRKLVAKRRQQRKQEGS